MFNEDEDWSDEAEAQNLSKAFLSEPARPRSNASAKPKSVGKKSLLHTLQTLGSVPEWASDNRQHDSDSEAEAAPSHNNKRKKKRRKRAKQAAVSEKQGEKGDLEEKTVTKRKKNNTFGSPKAKTTSVGEAKGKETTQSENKPENATKLSRKQWKNKMKNKRNCKNKYRQNEPKEEEVNKAESTDKQRSKEDVTADSQSNSKNGEKPRIQTETQNKKTEGGRKPLKRREPGEAADVPRASQTKNESISVEKGATESLADGSKQKVCESEVSATDQPQKPAKRPKPELSREESLKRTQLRKLLRRRETEQHGGPAGPSEEEEEEEPKTPEEDVKLDRSASLRSRMEQRLDSARFRYINEVLYSTSSGEAKRMFRQDPQAFWVYHRGYTAQVQKWPVNPVDVIISYIQKKPASLVVADFGCGDCKIARSVKNKVHSFDLAAACDLVTVCDMAEVPLADCSVDIAVFCLSLMGTNLADFLAEANRVLRMGGVLKIAEVASRFENVRGFIAALASLGFKMASKDTENTHFYSFEFVKSSDAPENIKRFGLQLKACVYKKR